MNIKLKSLKIENFKGIKDLNVLFGDKTRISGENASGKTTIFDAVMWLLFNKNSMGVEKFEIRPLDADGKTVDFVEIKVSAEFERETGETFNLEKVQKQNWTQHVGEETKTFTGNVNSYAVNGFPKSEKEYKGFIADIINEEQFKLLSSPTYFVNLPWKKQREILMSLISEETDLEFAKRVGGFDILIPELEIAPKTSDIVDKWKKAKKDLDAKQKELPVRIDEASKAKVDYDLTALTATKADLENKIALAKNDNASAVLAGLQSELSELKVAKSAMENKAKEEWLNARSAFLEKKGSIEFEKTNAENAIRHAKTEISNADAQIDRANKELKELGEDYHETHNMTFDETPYAWDSSAEVCPTCKRPLPAEDIEKAKRALAENRAKAMTAFVEKKSSKENALIEAGNKTKALAQSAHDEKVKAEKVLHDAELALADAEKKLAELGAFNMAEPTLTGAKDYDYLVQQIATKESEIANIQSKPATDVTSFELELEGVNNRIAQVQANASIDARIEELKVEQRDVAQRITTAEGMLYALDKFVKAKLENVSSAINGKFSMVNFKLFNVLLNGGVEETCECTFNGVPYSSLNNGMKICGGLDIINTLSKEFDKTVFVFTDNAEAINSYNFPNVSGQLIKLFVSDDKELVIKDE